MNAERPLHTSVDWSLLPVEIHQPIHRIRTTLQQLFAAATGNLQLLDGGLSSVDWSDPDQLCLLWEQK